MWKGALGPNTGPAHPKPYCSSLLPRLVCLVYVPVAEFFRNYFVCLFNNSFWFLLSPHSAISVTEHFSFTFIYGYSSSLLPPSLISSWETEVIDDAHSSGFPAYHRDELSAAPITRRPKKTSTATKGKPATKSECTCSGLPRGNHWGKSCSQSKGKLHRALRLMI